MIRPYILTETNWKAVKDQNFEIAVLPWGATEAHNYHLPYGTDNIEGTAIAEESARIAWNKGAKVIVLPTVPFGVNTGQRDINLDINMNPSTQFAVLKDILEVLDRQGIKKFMLLNSHGGNNWKSIIRELGGIFPEMFLCVANWPRALTKSEFFEEHGDHADEMETSLILYLAPQYVLPKSEWGSGKEKKNKISAFQQGWAWTERPWSQISNDTGVGDPSKATANKGKIYFEEVCEKIGGLIVDIAKENTNDLYE